MRWKAFLVCGFALCIVSGAVSSFGAETQPPAKVYRIGWLSPYVNATLPPGTILGGNRGTFIRALNDLGYVEGRNLVIDVRVAEGKTERLPGLAAELVALKPDVIVALTTPATKAAQQATTTIPIVIVQVSDPVGSGFVASLARPGGNITGVKDFDLEMAPKMVELAHALAPKATRVGVLISDYPLTPTALKAYQAAATSIGVTLLPCGSIRMPA
jgi:putative ABC transport system substrate-binding protein